jgi:hypothetical protein
MASNVPNNTDLGKSVDVEKMKKVCGMLGSDHAGERAAAAHQATRLLLAAGLTWSDLVAMAARPPLSPAAAPVSAQDDILAADLVRAVAGAKLTGWDAEFIASLDSLRKRYGEDLELSDKQWSHLLRIAKAAGLMREAA